MADPLRIAILSDVHYAGPSERQRGNDFEYRDLTSPLQRFFNHYYRHFFWLQNPIDQNHLLDQFVTHIGKPDHVIALGDYSCDSGFIGVSDPAALESANECLGRLRTRFGRSLHAVIGDHELGKFPLFGRRGGLRFESWRRTTQELQLPRFWRMDLGRFVFLGVTSTLITLPSSRTEMLDSELDTWEAEREAHLQEIRSAFDAVSTNQRVLLFCHDPTALPILWNEPSVRRRVSQIERTFIGHLHSPFILWKGRLLAGMPTIQFMGHTVKRLSKALGRAKLWKPFNVELCPSLAGLELLKDGGYLTVELEVDSERPILVHRHRLKR